MVELISIFIINTGARDWDGHRTRRTEVDADDSAAAGPSGGGGVSAVAGDENQQGDSE